MSKPDRKRMEEGPLLACESCGTEARKLYVMKAGGRRLVVVSVCSRCRDMLMMAKWSVITEAVAQSVLVDDVVGTNE